MNTSLGYSRSRMLKAASLFVAVLLFIFLIRSPSPLGISLTDHNINIIQVVGVESAQYQQEYFYERQFIGQVEAQQSSLLGFEIPGRLNKVVFDEGSIVKAGDILAKLDTARLDAQTNEAEANLIKAKADSKLANSTYKRIHAAQQVNAVSEQEKDEAGEGKESTAAAVKVAKAQLQSIKVDAEKSNLIAPYDGIVIDRLVDEGNVVNVGQTVLELQQSSNYNIRIGVSHEMIKSLRVGDQKNVKANGQSYSAVITAILPLRSLTRTIDVILKLNENKITIRPGDMVRLSLNYKVTTSGFWVPLTSLKEGRRGLWSLYIIEQNQNRLITKRRTIQVHYTNNDHAFVSGALENGEMVITQGAFKLVPGQEVRVMESKND
jgi:multidrug efflux system membrane fusion protein